MHTVRSTSRLLLQIRPTGPKCPLNTRLVRVRPRAIHALCVRYFSSLNTQRRPFSDWNEKAQRQWTEAELESMKEGQTVLGLRTRLFRRRVYDKPPTPFERTQWWKDAALRNLVGTAMFMVAIGVVYYFSPEIKIFDAPRFMDFSIISKEDVSTTSFIVTLRPVKFVNSPKHAKADPYKEQWAKGTWSVEFKQPELQIARSYTPLPPRDQDTVGDLRFLIRTEPDGEMSKYLAQLSVKSRIGLRGPHTELELPKEVTDVVFLAGGTGIAPALQVVHTLLQVQRPTDLHSKLHGHSQTYLPNIHIIWANRKREDCIGGGDISTTRDVHPAEGVVVRELRELQEKYPNNLRVDYLVDEEGSVLNEKAISRLIQRDSEIKHHALLSRIDSKILFVSGPEGFVSYIAGPKKYSRGGEAQGDLGGVLGKMKLRDWKVWKQ